MTSVERQFTQTAGDPVHVESLASLAEPEPDFSNDYRTYEKIARIRGWGSLARSSRHLRHF